MHNLELITTLAGGLGAALVLGWLTQRAGLSTLVGYMLAGIAVGPFTPGFVADSHLASQMAEIGVILLMFGVGLHFHPQDLLRVWRIALPGAVAQSAVATVAGWAVARAFGWSDAAGWVFGMALAVASTVVLMRMLVEQNRLSGRDGHVAVGWLIVEDIFTVVALVVLPALAAGSSDGPDHRPLVVELALALGQAGLFALLVWFGGTQVAGRLMDRLARTRSSELFTLAVFVLALGVAVLAATVFQVSVALGAFLAGLVVGQSRFGAQAAADMTPFRDVFSALFFVSVGMLFNPGFVLEQPGLVLAALGVVMVLKPLVAMAVVRLLRDTGRTAGTVSVGLAQIGEFSFILAAMGSSLKLLPPAGLDALVVVAIGSIAVNPLLFRALAAWERRADRLREALPAAAAHSGRPNLAAGEITPLIVTGLGEVGRRVLQRCSDSGIAARAIDNDLEQLDAQRQRGVDGVFGDASRDEVLHAAGVGQARALVVTNASIADKLRICIAVRRANPRTVVIATAMNSAERAWLQESGAAIVCDALDELTEAVLRSVRAAV